MCLLRRLGRGTRTPRDFDNLLKSQCTYHRHCLLVAVASCDKKQTRLPDRPGLSVACPLSSIPDQRQGSLKGGSQFGDEIANCLGPPYRSLPSPSQCQSRRHGMGHSPQRSVCTHFNALLRLELPLGPCPDNQRRMAGPRDLGPLVS